MRILDLTAGARAIWFDKEYKDALFLDTRAEVLPDLICDPYTIPEAAGRDFCLVVFDPPHVNFGKNANMSCDYGHHTTEQIRRIIRSLAEASAKISLPDALMAFKWNDHDQKLYKVLELMDQWWEPLFGHTVSSRTKHSSQTYWVMLRRRSCP